MSEKVLTPLQAKTAMRVAIREALDLRKNARLSIEEKHTSNGTTFRMYIPSSYYNAVGFTVYYFPGCCKYGIISQLFCNGKMAQKKLSYHVLNWALAQIVYEGYSKAVGTTASPENLIMEKILRKTGWKQIDKGLNANSGNKVTMWIKATGQLKRDVFLPCDS